MIYLITNNIKNILVLFKWWTQQHIKILLVLPKWWANQIVKMFLVGVPNGETPNLVEQLHKPTLVLPRDCRPR